MEHSGFHAPVVQVFQSSMVRCYPYAAASRNSYVVSRSLTIDYVLNYSGTSVQSVSIPISVGIIASIP